VPDEGRGPSTSRPHRGRRSAPLFEVNRIKRHTGARLPTPRTTPTSFDGVDSRPAASQHAHTTTKDSTRCRDPCIEPAHGQPYDHERDRPLARGRTYDQSAAAMTTNAKRWNVF
jgi:hypothetical protein